VPGAPLRLGSGTLLWRASNLASVMREAFGHHVGACFNARYREQGAGRQAPGAQEFVTKAIEEFQEARAMHGERRPAPPSAAAAPDLGSELCICDHSLGLNRAASQELFWPSRVGRCGGRPHSYVRMPFGLPHVAASHQHHMRRVLVAHEARRQAILTEEVPDPREPPGPPEPHEAREPDDS
jgi:hypothetical protein